MAIIYLAHVCLSATMPSMWLHFVNLVVRSLGYMPSIISQNWVSIFLPLVVFIVRESVRLRKEGWRAMNWTKVRNDSLWMIGVYVLLFGWAVIHTVYTDHVYLTDAARGLRYELVQCKDISSPKLSGEITVTNVRRNAKSKKEQLIEVQGLITNQGAPTLITGWSVELRLGDGTIVPGHILVPPMNMISEVPKRDHNVQLFLRPEQYWTVVDVNQAIPTGAGRGGWLYALFPDTTTEYLEGHHATFVLKVRDIKGKQWPIEQTLDKSTLLRFYTSQDIPK